VASIDERVVQMTFKGATFLTGVASVISALDKLKQSITGLKGTSKALDDVSAAGKKIDLSHVADGVDKISSKFTAMGALAVGALMRIGGAAAAAGGRLLKSLTIAPILAGLDTYSTKLNAIQTILANTQGQQGSNLKNVSAALAELNTYADKTIFRFADMTKNIGLFTAAGVNIKDSVSSIKGLSNIAALSGSSAQQAAGAMYQMSQAIATGTVRLIDWNSVVNAGMGGKVFQNSLIQTARTHGVAVDEMIKKNGSFRDSLQEGWLTANIMTETLSKFTGDLTDKQLKTLGYSDKQIKSIQAQAKAAVNAATQVRTVTQLMETMADGTATAWSHVWEAVLGNLPQATQLLTGVAAGLSKVFIAPITHLGTLLQKWNELGGRQAVINGLTAGIKLLGQVLRPIGQAFREVFPPMTAERLVEMSKAFENFVKSIKISSTTINNIKTIFRGLFDALKIGIDIIKGVFSVFGKVASAATGAGGGILGLIAKVASLVTGFRHVLENGDAIGKFFRGLGTVLAAPVKVLGSVVHGFDSFVAAIGRALGSLGPFVDKVIGVFKGLAGAIINALRSGDIQNVANVINQGLLGGILLAIRNFIKNLGKGGKGLGLIDSIKGVFSALTDTLQNMQDRIKAGTLQKIAIAVGILAASIVALSFVDAGRLTKSLTAIGIMFGQLLFAMNILGKISVGLGVFKVGAVAASLILMSTAILILAGAVAILAQFNLVQLAKGIGSVAVMLGILVGATRLMAKDAKGLVTAAAAMVVMALALNLMSGAVAILGHMDVSALAKGVVTIAILLALMAGFNKFGGVQLIGTAVAMIALGVALNVIAGALKILGGMSLAQIGKALLAVAGGLIIIAIAMNLMPQTMLASAAGLLVVSIALTILSKALQSMGKMSWGEIGKSMVVLAGSLLILAAAMIAMAGALPGAAALLVISASLAILTPVLITLGSLSWGTILKGFAALAGVFLIFAAAGLLLGPVVPILLGLSAAIALFGVGLMALGAGILFIGTGLTAIGVAVTVSGAAIVAFVTSILNLIPFAMKKIGEGIVQFAVAIGKSGAAITDAFTTILTSLLKAVIKVVPLIGKAVQTILTTFLNLIVTNTPRIVNVMIRLVMALLNAIASNMPRFVQKGTDIIVAFLNGIARNIPRIVQAGVNIVVAFINAVGAQAGRVSAAAIRMIIGFVNTLASQIRGSSGAMRSAGFNLAGAIIDGMTGGLASKAGAVIGKAASIGASVISALGKAIKFFSPSHYTYAMGIGIMEGLMFGMISLHSDLIKTAEDTGQILIDALKTSVELASEMVDIQPTITPVIDLTGAKKGFDDLATMAAAGVIPVTTTAAAGAVSATAPSPPVEGVAVAMPGGTVLNFTQNNTSPVALSSAEIYRQTKNQLSQAKGALPLCLPW
jgi:tape measure domain-containing protein